MNGRAFTAAAKRGAGDFGQRQTRKAIVERVTGRQLGRYLDGWVERYEEVGRRSRLLWQWCLEGVHLISLPCVPSERRDHVGETKLLNVMFTTLVDDIADERHDAEMMAAARGIVDGATEFDSLGPERARYLSFTAAVWREMWERAATYPNFPELAPLLEFDYRQIVNAMDYSLIVNRLPQAVNPTEHDLYVSHNLTVTFMAMLDLAASPGCPATDLGTMREAFWEAQRMARIGDVLMTWPREVRIRDASSGVIAHLMNRGILTPEDLGARTPEELVTVVQESDFEDWSLRRWREHRDALVERIARLGGGVLDGWETKLDALLEMHLAFRGFI